MLLSYELDKEFVTEALGEVCGLAQVTIEDPPVVRQALVWHQEGLDFADALHLATSRQAESFYTFDQELVCRAKRGKTATVV